MKYILFALLAVTTLAACPGDKPEDSAEADTAAE